MANSLQDQLVKAGLATADQARTTRKSKRKDRKSGKAREDGARRAAERRRAEQAAKDRELNAKREAEREEKELRSRIRDRVLGASLNQDGADVPYNVLHGTKVRRIHVTAEQRDGLVAGSLAVATARGRHHVIPAAVADEIRALMPDYFVHRQEPKADVGEANPDDPYAGYEVPDDLTW